jgi:hypothetical protein
MTIDGLFTHIKKFISLLPVVDPKGEDVIGFLICMTECIEISVSFYGFFSL